MLEDSRLERFLKALCSLDYSDLPTPLSRVEVLWNCLITGEATPDFQPQSRTEKYLMTILGVYDLEDIPKPISRAETLLYKLATGDTDVELEDCVKSRYERLLSEIVANGGVGDNVDFEYVTYVLSESFNTLYNTDEAPVKSAILKGQTLVNISPLNGEITLTPASVQHIDSPFIKSNTTFTISFNCSSVPTTGFIEFRQIFENTALKMENKPVVQGYNQFKVTTVSSEINRFRFKNDSTSETDFTFNNLMIIEGDYTNVDIPFFEGMKSVQMPVLTTIGKNLCSVSNNVFMPTSTSTWYFANGVQQTLFGSKLKRNSDCEWFYLPYGVYAFSFGDGTSSGFQLIAEGEKRNYSITNNTPRTISEGWYTVRIKSPSSNLEQIRLVNLQIEKGSKPTSSYEPYKSNILTVNEEVVLRGIGDVQDTLDLMTGEVVERVGEVIFDGSVDENWNLWATYPEESAIFRLSKENSLKLMKEFDKNGVFKCDKFSTVLQASIINSGNIYPHAISFFGSDGEYIQLRVYKSLLKSIDVDGLREYLANEQITVQYYLATEVVKTVDLSVVNQDGNNTKLSTFNDLTHVTLSSEGLIPEAELEVATKNEEALNTMSLEMDDISTTQNALQEISNIQSENVDATMMATTEIYEQLL